MGIEQSPTNCQQIMPFTLSEVRADGMRARENGLTSLHLLTLDEEPRSQPLLPSSAHKYWSEAGPAISPDGHWIAYNSTESGQSEIYVRPFPNVSDAKWTLSRDGGFGPVWSPDMREIFYNDSGTIMAVPVTTEPSFTAENPQALFVKPGIYPFFDISPDGERLLMLKRVEETGDAPPPNELILVQNWFDELERLVPGGN